MVSAADEGDWTEHSDDDLTDDTDEA